jgi:hypothetical protein
MLRPPLFTEGYAAGLQAASKAAPAVRARTSAPDASSTCAADGDVCSPLVSAFT